MFKRFLKIDFLYNYINKRQAGHSKWANIKHTKALKDSERSKLFTKIAQQIKVAVQEGGSINPNLNQKLEQIVAHARRSNMPVATIENVIKSTQKDKTHMKSFTFEIKGPGNCMILCEVCSPNLVKTKMDLATIMKKHACRFSDGGGRHLFDYKGIIDVAIPSPLNDKSKDEILEIATNHAIDSEAEDVEVTETNSLQFTCHPHSFMKVQKSLEQLEYKIAEATLDYIPFTRIPLSDNDVEVCSKFFEKLRNIDEVVGLYDNIV